MGPLPPAPLRQEKPNKRKGAWCKFAGTFIVLAAFAFQNFEHDKWKEKAETTTRLILKAKSARQDLDRARTFRIARTGGSDLFSDYLVSFGELCEYVKCGGSNNVKFPFSFEGLVELDNSIQTPQQLDAFLVRTVNTERNLLDSAELARDHAASNQRNLRVLFIALYIIGSGALLVGLLYEVRGASE